MGRQYFEDLSAEPPIANLTAITATTETALWLASRYTPIAANEARAGKCWRITAGGIMSFAATGNLIITPRVGLTVAAGISLGPNVVAVTTPGATTAHPWMLDFVLVCRTIGDPGVNSTFAGTGRFTTGTPGAAGAAVCVSIGGTVATADASIATGFCCGWTLSVAGSVTTQYAVIQPMS